MKLKNIEVSKCNDRADDLMTDPKEKTPDKTKIPNPSFPSLERAVDTTYNTNSTNYCGKSSSNTVANARSLIISIDCNWRS